MHRTARTLFLSLAATLAFAGTAGAASPNLVVSQVYGGGGNAGATHTHDFIEIFNRGDAAVSLGGKSLQYASATGTGNLGANDTQLTDLPNVTLAPGQYFLVQEGAGAGNGVALPTPDHVDGTAIAMAAGAGKVALADGTASLGCNGGSTPCTAEQLARIVDLVGYGNANFFEGGAAAPTLTNSTAAQRAGAGCTDTDQNGSDFASATPAPRNTASPTTSCAGDEAPSVTGGDPANGANDVALDSNVDVTFSEPVSVDAGGFSLACEASGTHTVTVTGGSTTFTLDPAGSFARGETCTVTVSAGAVHDVDTSDPPDTMAGNATIRFTTVGLEGLRIHDIQGDSHISPYDGRIVTGLAGVVTARRSNGFYLQDPNPDRDSETSEGILVFTNSAPPPEAAVGASVLVSGRVDEFRFADAPEDLTVTEIVQPTVTPAGTGTVQPTVIGKGGRKPPTKVIDDDSRGDVDLNPFFDPREDGIDFHESLEGMVVRINQAVAVGPTNGFGEVAVVGDKGKDAGLRTRRGGVLVRPFDFNPERLILDDVIGDTPAMNVGDRFTGPITAVVDYSFGNFKYYPLTTPTRVDGGLEREVTDRPGRDELAVGSFNVENLTPNDSAAKYQALAQTLIVNMRAPDIVAVEEIQDNDGATNSAITAANLTWERLIAEVRAAGGPTYDYRQIDPVDDQDGGQPGGNIRVGFLFRTDRGLSFVDRPGGTPTSAVGVVDTRRGAELTFSPGRIEPGDAAWTASRKPLAGEFRWRGETVIAVANHFNSKGGDDPLFGRFQPPVRHTEPQRHQQATLVNEFAEDVLDADRDANLIVLGDLNDFDFSETLDILEGRELFNLMRLLPPNERYSYVFDGNSQVLDQILVSDELRDERPEYDSVHMNAEFADQTSDHDPQVARLEVDGRGGRDHDDDDDDD